PIGVVEEVEREGGRQAREENDLESLAPDGSVDGGEPRIAGNARRDALAGQRAPEEEGDRGLEVGRYPNERHANCDAVGETRPEGEDESRQEEHTRDHVRDQED